MDYITLSAVQLQFQPNAQLKQDQCTEITIIDDSILEHDTESFTVLLDSAEPLKVVVGTQEATVTILDDDGNAGLFYLSSCPLQTRISFKE